MNQLLTLAGVLAVLTAVTLADAQGEKPPTIKEIMTKLNKGPNSMTPSLGKDLRDNPVDWDHIQKEAKIYASLVATVQKSRPPKGDAASWDKLVKAYAEKAKAFEDAAEKKDQKGAQAAVARLANVKDCKTCHDAHR
jgi:hypothetical protein